MLALPPVSAKVPKKELGTPFRLGTSPAELVVDTWLPTTEPGAGTAQGKAPPGYSGTGSRAVLGTGQSHGEPPQVLLRGWLAPSPGDQKECGEHLVRPSVCVARGLNWVLNSCHLYPMSPDMVARFSGAVKAQD